MCGIAGIVSSITINQKEVNEYSSKVSESIYHRGPDGLGTWYDDNILLIHRRLKIIDLSDSANQPFISSNGNFVLIFNGEIYNYKELAKSHLANKKFRTSSDTEVLICLYEKYGEECVKLLNGIFSFCIYDLKNKKIQLFRDQYGVKPLYYSFESNRFIFCSEIKGLFAMDLQPKLNEDHIVEQIYYGYVAGENTIFKNVKRLLPGTFLTVDFQNTVSFQKTLYFDLTQNRFENDYEVTEEDVYNGLKQAVKRQMVSDVPVGFMCSGGIDSSAIAALSAQITNKVVNTYCAKVVEENCDESQYAQIVSDFIGSKHKVIESLPEDIAKLLPCLIWAHDEPLKHPNSIPIYQVNKQAKNDITVMLTGEGSDEFFAGYWVFPLINKLNILRRIVPGFAKKTMLYIFKKIGRQAKSIQAIMAKSVPEMYIAMSTAYDTSKHVNLIKELKLDLEERKRIAKESFKGANHDVFQGFLYFYQQIHLVSLFDRQDKMSMINSLEGRVPFVDVVFVKLVNSISKDKKVIKYDTKVILKHSMKNSLPKEIFTRPKYAFALPIVTWINKSESFKKMFYDVYNGYLVRNNIIDKNEYEILLNKFISGNTGLGDLMWNILNLDLLARIFIEKENIIDWDEFKYRIDNNTKR